MSSVKLDEKHEVMVNRMLVFSENVHLFLNEIEMVSGSSLWLNIGRTQIDLGLIAIRESITEKFKEGGNDGTNSF